MKPLADVPCPVCKKNNKVPIKVPTRWQPSVANFICSTCACSVLVKCMPVGKELRARGRIELKTMLTRVSDLAQLKHQIYGKWVDDESAAPA